MVYRFTRKMALLIVPSLAILFNYFVGESGTDDSPARRPPVAAALILANLLHSRPIAACILTGGFTAGALDHLSACATLIPRGIPALGMLQYIASGAIGQRAFSGGLATAIVGLAVHFSLTTLMAAIYVFASLRIPKLLSRPWTAGVLYGAAVCVVMNYVAVPLSLVPHWKAPTGWDLVGAFLASCLYVGVPIASLATYFLGPYASKSTASAPEVTSAQ